jgi:hypothetical protein
MVIIWWRSCFTSRNSGGERKMNNHEKEKMICNHEGGEGERIICVFVMGQ